LLLWPKLLLLLLVWIQQQVLLNQLPERGLTLPLILL
jgi:hypothetical protein